MEALKRGMPVRVVKGRKAPIGFEGYVFWEREESYGGGFAHRGGYKSPTVEQRIGIKNADGEIAWTYAKNVERIYSEAEKAEIAAREAAEAAEIAAAEAAREAREARRKAAEALIDFNGAVSFKPEDQGGWGGTNFYEATFKAEASDAELQEAVNARFPSTSSCGALRWTTGAGVISVDRERNMVRYSVSYGMCD